MSGNSAEIAPDGSEVQPLGRVENGSMARFTFAAGRTSRAVKHRRVEELWYVVSGTGEIWRSPDCGACQLSDLVPGASISIPAGCGFQVRVSGAHPLVVVGVTMPAWPGDEEAIFVQGHWDADV